MGQDSDEERIRRKAHELWQAEGHPHGRDVAHWEQAREIIAIQDSQGATLLPRDFGASEPVESSAVAASYGDVPGLTDQGEHDLTDVSREPGSVAPGGRAPGLAERATETAAASNVVSVAQTKSRDVAAPKLGGKRDGATKGESLSVAKKKK